jgi:Secretion system C-terminal sorting domain
MKSKIVYSFVVIAITTIIFSAQSFSFSDYGYPDHTSAPGQGTCASGGCHSGNPENSSLGSVDIITNIPSTGWVVGQQYKITAKISFPGRTLFGFELMAWSHKDSLSTGTLSADSATSNAQIVYSWENGVNTYATHKLKSLSGLDGNEWTFDWTAPTDGTDTVTFFANFNAANSNGKATGDYIFTKSLTLSSGTILGINESFKNKNNVYVFPSVATDFINVTYNAEQMNGAITIYSIDGKMVYQQNNLPYGTGKLTEKIDVSHFTNGVYFASVQNGGNRSSVKFVKQ